MTPADLDAILAHTTDTDVVTLATALREAWAATKRAEQERDAATARVAARAKGEGVMSKTRRASKEDLAATAVAGVSRQLFWKRVDYGWTMHDAARTPPRPWTDHTIDGRKAVTVAREHGVGAAAFVARIRRGMGVVEAATTPTARPRRDDGLSALAKEHGVSRMLYFARIALGWSPEEAAMTPPRAYRRTERAVAP